MESSLAWCGHDHVIGNEMGMGMGIRMWFHQTPTSHLAGQKQMALIHNCLASQAMLCWSSGTWANKSHQTNSIRVDHVCVCVWVCGQQGCRICESHPCGFCCFALAACLPACCHLLTFHYIYFTPRSRTGHNCQSGWMDLPFDVVSSVWLSVCVCVCVSPS